MRRGRSIGTSKLAVTRPGRGDITTMRSPRRAASRTLWVTNTTVRPRSRDERLELLVEHVAGHRVERAERLVHQQDVGVLGEGPGQRAALAHAARQLVGTLVGEAAEVHRPTSSWSTRSRRSALGTPASRIGSSTLAAPSATGTAPTPGTSARPGPARRPCPRSASSSPATRLRIVDLPQPDAPIRHTNSPPSDLEVDPVEGGDAPVPRPERLVDAAEADGRTHRCRPGCCDIVRAAVPHGHR